MTTRYQKSQIEDVARILSYHTTAAGMDDEQERMQWLTWIAKSFVDLFAADNPPRCSTCGASVCSQRGHVFASGFDRERFLAACGLIEDEKEFSWDE
ncbi:hypothetical protein LCGC14_1765150 [marine sediment metagenome]|uniref:Uncharacterized protein n=1 Tax=marine sediment metagenome TaxID=412755 RepID=A0A0F9GZX4_9ZZZZ